MAMSPGGAGHSSGALTVTQASELPPSECSSCSTRRAPGMCWGGVGGVCSAGPRARAT